MKRDPNLVRSLLLHYEAKPDDRVDSIPNIRDRSESEIKYHLILMYDAGFLRAEPELTKTGRVIAVHPLSLTWQGHEFLDAARNETIWRKATKAVTSKTGAMSFSVLQEVLLAYTKAKLGI